MQSPSHAIRLLAPPPTSFRLEIKAKKTASFFPPIEMLKNQAKDRNAYTYRAFQKRRKTE